MDYTLYVGDYAYSSWSLRGWLLLDAFGMPFTKQYAHMKTDAFEALKAEMAPSQLVPALSISDGTRAPVIVWDSLAMAETLHEYHPQAGYWPKGASARPTARSQSSCGCARAGFVRSSTTLTAPRSPLQQPRCSAVKRRASTPGVGYITLLRPASPWGVSGSWSW